MSRTVSRMVSCDGLAAQGDTIPPDVAPAFNDGTTLTAITREPGSGAVLLVDSGE